jgi:hypothetical protein
MEGFNSVAQLKGNIRLEVVSKDGNILDVREVTNTVMNTGKAQVAALILSDVGGTAFDYLALGTSNTAPSASQTALQAEVYRTAGTGTRITTSVANDTAKLSGSFSITASATLREMGILNSSSTGILLARATFSDLAVNNADTVNAIYNIVVA